MKNFSLFLVLFAVFINWMGIGLVYPIFSSMLYEPSSAIVASDTSETLRGTYLGILLATAPLIAFFSGPILGMFSDQKGRKPILLFGLLFGFVGYLIAAIAVQYSSLFLLIATRVLVGVSMGSAAVVSAAIADMSAPHEKAKRFGLYSMAMGLGFTVGPFLGGVLSNWDFSFPFLFSGFVTLVNFLLIFGFFKETFKGRQTEKIKLTTGLKNIKKAFSMPALDLIFLVAFLFAFAWSFFYEFVPTIWIGEYGFGTQMVGILYAYGAGIYALSAGWLIRPIVNRFKAYNVLLWSLLSLGLYILLFLIRPQGFWFWAYMPPLQFLAAILFPTATTLVSNGVDAQMQGETLGVLQSVQSASFALSPILAGPLLGISPDMPIYVGAGALLLAAAFLAYSKHWKMRRIS